MSLLCEPVTSLADLSHTVSTACIQLSFIPWPSPGFEPRKPWSVLRSVNVIVFCGTQPPAPPVLWCAGTYQQGSNIRSAATHVNAKQGLHFLTGFVWSNLRFKLLMPSNIKMSLYEPVDYRSCANWEAEECNGRTEAGKQCFVRPLRWTVLNGVQNEMKQRM
jgi:hypothetical protein